MRLFFRQLGGEFYKLGTRPRTWFAFAATLVFEFLVSSLLHIGSVRTMIARDLWKMRWHFDENFSGLTTASHILGEATMIIGALGVALVASDIMATESEEGTLFAIAARPVSRVSVFAQKFIVCTCYAVALALFCGASALAVGLLFEGKGPLLMIATHEEIIGTFDYETGLARYQLAVALLAFSAFSGMVAPFAFGCFDIRPAAAAALSLSIIIADSSIRVAPEFHSVRPWCITTRLLAWRHAFNDTIPWRRIQRHYTFLAWWDVAWVGAGFVAFRRRDITR